MSIIWETPQLLFNNLHSEFNFTLDVCALKYNAKCEVFFTPELDGLSQEWQGVCWCNPPFDKTMGSWIEKSYLSAQQGATVVCLFPGNYHDNKWWHDFVMRSSEIRYMRGRCKFHHFERVTSMRTLIVVFRPFCVGPPQTSSIYITGEPYNNRIQADAKEPHR